MITTKKRQEFRIKLQKRARRRAEKRIEILEEDKSLKEVITKLGLQKAACWTVSTLFVWSLEYKKARFCAKPWRCCWEPQIPANGSLWQDVSADHSGSAQCSKWHLPTTCQVQRKTVPRNIPQFERFCSNKFTVSDVPSCFDFSFQILTTNLGRFTVGRPNRAESWLTLWLPQKILTKKDD